MNIVILDGYTLNPGDLDWELIRKFGNVIIYERSATNQILERATGADVLLVNKVVLSEEILNRLPQVRYIGVTATGYNNIDMEATKKKGITVTNVKAYSGASVTQLTFSLLLALVNHAELHSESVHNGDWVASPDFCYWKTPLTELAGKTMGLIGLGDIGSQVAKVAGAFGMNVIAYRKHPKPEVGIEIVSLEAVFKRSDVLSLHCPLTEETKEIVNAERLSWMKPNAFVLNTGRGSLIQEADLADALKNRTIAGAGLDVLSTEPPKADNPLLSAPNCLITPHIAWASFEARKRLMHLTAENLEAFIHGNPKNVVS